MLLILPLLNVRSEIVPKLPTVVPGPGYRTEQSQRRKLPLADLLNPLIVSCRRSAAATGSHELHCSSIPFLETAVVLGLCTMANPVDSRA